MQPQEVEYLKHIASEQVASVQNFTFGRIARLIPFVLLIGSPLFIFFYFPYAQSFALVMYILSAILCCLLIPKATLHQTVYLTRLDFMLLLYILSAAAVVYCWTLSSSLYFIWGDEGEATFVARLIAKGEKKNIFWGLGIFSEHPVLGSLISSYFFRFFGESIATTRASVIIPSIFSGAFLFLTLKLVYGTRYAWAGLILFLLSYYHYQFGHLSYNNLWLVPSILIPFALLQYGLTTDSKRALFSGALLMGIGTLFTYQAITVLVVLTLTSLVQMAREAKKKKWGRIKIFLVGLVAGTTPFLLTARTHITKIIEEHLSKDAVAVLNGSYSTAHPWDSIVNVASKFSTALLAPIYSDLSWHFIHGAFFDPLTGLLWATGLILLIKDLIDGRNFGFSLAILALTFAFSLSNIISPYHNLSATRFTYLIALVPLTVVRVFELLAESHRKWLVHSLTWGLVALIGCLNIAKVFEYRLWAAPIYQGSVKLWQEQSERSPKVSLILIPDSWRNSFKEAREAFHFSPTVFGVGESELASMLEKIPFPDRILIHRDFNAAQYFAVFFSILYKTDIKTIPPKALGNLEYYSLEISKLD